MSKTLATAVVLVVSVLRVVRAPGPAADDDPPPSRPVVAWPSGPLEVIVASGRPLAPAVAKAMIGRTITYDDPRSNGSQAPATTGPAHGLRIVGARLRDDGRTLVLATDPHPIPAHYRLPWPPDQPDSPPTATYDLSGAEAAWTEGEEPGGEPKWSGWWPALDPDATRWLTRGSRSHETGLALMDRPGRLALSNWVRLPAGQVTFRVRSTRPIEEVTLGDAQAAGPGGTSGIELTVTSRSEPLFLMMTVRTGGREKPFRIEAGYRMAGETADHPVDRDRLLLPWSPPSTVAAIAAPMAVPDLSGGDPERGRALFRGDQARCAHCHAFRGEGGRIGPDLTGIAAKGRAEIYRSIAAPSAAIEPDYTTYTVATRDGRVFSGVVRAEGPDAIQVTDTNAHVETVRRDELQEIRPSATSIMPPGLAAALGDSAVRDLIAYLTAPAGPAHP